mgnify:FL=1|tara:strand:+ start:1283 stop:1474 length:192 start_codon:yes stop_codon:yes gene_type:complete
MNKVSQWLPDQLDTEKSKELVLIVSEELDYNIDYARAFAVALLTNVNDHNAASLINDVLLGAE